MSGTTMTLLKGFLWLLAAFDVLYGVYALSAPARAAAGVGIQLEAAGAHGEIRAIYGGMMVAMGVVTAGALVLDRPDWLVALGIVWCGLVAGRVVSVLAEGPARLTLVLGAVEAVSAVAMIVYGRAGRG
jgi:hypothetical protein